MSRSTEEIEQDFDVIELDERFGAAAQTDDMNFFNVINTAETRQEPLSEI